jgi:hypothetical protein
MRWYVIIGFVAVLVAYGTGVRQAGADWVPGLCYTFEEGGPGCGSCSASGCADCIQGNPPTCNPATHTKCYPTNILTGVDWPAGYTRVESSSPCGGIYFCDNPGGGQCIGPCVDGSFYEPLPGDPRFSLYIRGAKCANPIP